LKSPLLIAEPPLQALPTLAAEIGINESIVLQQIHYWSLHKIRAGEEPWVYNTQEKWVEEFPWLSLRTFQRVIDKLRDLELLLIDQPEGTNRRAHYSVNYDKLPYLKHDKVAASSRQNGGLSSKAESSTEKTPKTPSRKKVGGKVVTDDEFTLAAAVVSQFNSSAGTELTTEPHLTPIVGRIRERPKLTAEQHGKIVEAVFAGDNWWTGPPTPKIIYGNPAIFEQSIELARARSKRRRGTENPNAERERVKQEFEDANDAD
jgi:hypothetical protein